MKKFIFYSVIAILFAGFASLTSCEKYEQSTAYEINDSITATITGYVYADLDLQDTDNEYAPSGTKIFVKIDLQEYNGNASANKQKVYSTTVGSDGKYSFTIPSNDKGVTFTVVPEKFRTTQTQYDGSTEEVIFQGDEFMGEVISDQKYIQDIYYY